MKWFQVDADTPNDPKIRALIRELGAEGLGALFLLWCHIADHGSRRPGWSIDASGKPMPVQDLIYASGVAADVFTRLVDVCVESGHFARAPWQRRQVIAIPAMERRADHYTKRKTSGAPERRPYGESGMTRRQIFERDDHRCKYCGRQFPPQRLEVDHIVPLFRGGTDDPANLTTACKSCNRKKGTEMLDEDGTRRPATFAVQSTSVAVLASSTRQHSTSHTKVPPVVPLAGGRITRAERREAERVRHLQFGCQHDPRCASVDACIERLVLDRRARTTMTATETRR